MSLTRLSLHHFRNHSESEFFPPPGLVVLFGDNGAGKTNILEAISLLAPGRGLRRAPLRDMIRDHSSTGFAIFAEFISNTLGATVKIGTGTKTAMPTRREVRVNGTTSAPSSLSKFLSILWLTPEMDRLFADSTENRRRFYDRLVLALEPAHAYHNSRYAAALRARNKLLADSEGFDRHWLDSLEEQIARHGAEIDKARLYCLSQLTMEIDLVGPSPFAQPRIAMVDFNRKERSIPLQAEQLRAALFQRRRVDTSAGRATYGPHRDDFAVWDSASQRPAAQCSTGEQKSLLLALILAHADCVARQRGERPLLLLDEVAAHLDPIRRGALFERLTDTGGQAWLTGTETRLFSQYSNPIARYRITNGAAQKIPS